MIAAPGVLVISKIIIPETNSFEEEQISLNRKEYGVNFIDSIARGTMQGLKIAATIGAMLIVFIAMVQLANAIFIKTGDISGINDFLARISNGKMTELSFQNITGFLLSPFAWLTGINAKDTFLVGSLAGDKLILNEFVAYANLASYNSEGVFFSQRSVIISSYILCGFANLGSVGMQIGAFSIIVPEKKAFITSKAIKAMIAGTLTSFLSASVAGIFIQ